MKQRDVGKSYISIRNASWYASGKLVKLMKMNADKIVKYYEDEIKDNERILKGLKKIFEGL